MESTDKSTKPVVSNSSSTKPTSEPEPSSETRESTSLQQGEGPSLTVPDLPDTDEASNKTSNTNNDPVATTSATAEQRLDEPRPAENQEDSTEKLLAVEMNNVEDSDPDDDIGFGFFRRDIEDAIRRQDFGGVKWQDLYSLSVSKLARDVKIKNEHAKEKALALAQDPHNDQVPKFHKSNQQGPMLMKSLVDYIQAVEARVSSLETGGVGKPQEQDDDPQTRDTQKSTHSASDPALALGVKFLNVTDGFNSDGHFITGKNKDLLMEKHFMTVLYNWNVGYKDRTPSEGHEWPDSTAIDIVAIFLRSEPLSAFLRIDIPLDLPKDRFLRMTKPFRPLILGIAAMRKQLNFLETKFG